VNGLTDCGVGEHEVSLVLETSSVSTKH
jgi:hypothetical protein